MAGLVHVWYIQYGDNIHQLDPMTMYEQALTEIKKTDPDASIEEVRVYQYQMAFYVNHPTWTQARIARQPALWIQWVWIIAVALAALFAAAGVLINAIINFIAETRTYTDTDPETGETVTITGWSAYLAWLAAHKPEALTALQNYQASNWWEQILGWVPIILILIGAAIVLPFVVKLIPKGKGTRIVGYEPSGAPIYGT